MMALLVLVFTLLVNFLLKSIDRFLGRIDDIWLLFEYMFLNLGWIAALAVPMAVLIATLMAFGRMSSDNELIAIRTSGIGYRSLLFPSLIFGIIIAVIMTYFNNYTLPEMNHSARLLSSDIVRKHPGLTFSEGFNDDLPGYTIHISRIIDGIYQDVTVYDTRQNASQRTIIAKTGMPKIIANQNLVMLDLLNGVIHEKGKEESEYRQIFFDSYQVLIPVDNLNFSRRDSDIRGDREMTFPMIKTKITKYHDKIEELKERVSTRLAKENLFLESFETLTHKAFILQINESKESVISFLDSYHQTVKDSLELENNRTQIGRLDRRIKKVNRGINDDFKYIASCKKNINKYSVEFHKKFSIPFASIVFILIGAPIGIITRKGGFAVSAALSIGFFIVYWGFLITGEEFADRGYLSPHLSMWLPNYILGSIGAYLCYYTSREQQYLKLEFLSLLKFKRKKINDLSV